MQTNIYTWKLQYNILLCRLFYCFIFVYCNIYAHTNGLMYGDLAD